MARRPASVPIISVEADRIIGRLLFMTAIALVTATVAVQLWRWVFDPWSGR